MNQSTITKGTFYLATSQLIFALTGYLIHIGLGRILQPAEYGIFSTIISIVTLPNLVLATGIPQAVSKFISEDTSRVNNIKKVAIKFQIKISILIFIFYLFGAYPISWLLNDCSLVFYLQVSALIIPFYALYALYVGIENGLRNYKAQSLNVIIFSIGKVVLIFILIFLGFSLFGAILGFSIAPVIGVIVGFIFTRTNNSEQIENTFSLNKLIKFAMPVTIFWISYQFVMSIDLFAVKSLLENSNSLAGYYSAASMISRISYFFIAALSSTFFPIISNTTYKNEEIKTIYYIKESIRYAIIVLSLFILVIYSYAEQIITFLYGDSYIYGTYVLKILIIAMSIFGMYTYFLTLLTSGNHPNIAMIISVGILIFDFILNILLVPIFNMSGASYATLISSSFGLLISSYFVYINFKTIGDLRSTIKIIFSLLFVTFLLIPLYKNLFNFIFGSIINISIYLVILILIKEINKKDINRALSLINLHF